MTQEQKDLLLKDLCARLPYRVKFKFKYSELSSEIMRAIYLENYVIISSKDNSCEINDIKPYLFPLSSMTEEQEKELKKVYSDEADLIAEHLKSDISGNIHTHRFNHQLSLNWYLKNHFDINGLIPMGLAIDATNLNIY